MKIGKREQIVLISVGAALVIFLAHFFVFQPRGAKYAETEKLFTDGASQISQAEVPNSPEYVRKYNEKTAQYRAEITSLTAALKLDVPKQYLSFGEAAIDQRLDDSVRLLRELIAKRSSVRTPQLSFLDDRRLPNDPYQIQQGWSIPKELPSLGVEGALWDTVVKIRDQYELMKSIKDPVERLRRRVAYNELIGRLGIKAAEVSNFYAQVPYGGVVFFNDIEHYKQLIGAPQGGAATGGFYGSAPTGSVIPQFNTYLSTDRFGVLVPVLKRLWISELIWAKKDPSSRMTKKELREVLEVNFPKDESLLCLNKQLEGLLDMVTMAEKNGISEITRVNLLKPGGIGKALDREPGKVPTPKPSPTPGAGVYGGSAAMFGEPGMMGGQPGMAGPPGMMAGPAGMMGAPMGMGMGMATPTPAVDKIGSGSGVEIWFRGTNPSTVKFLFDVTHQPRTYAVDDLHIQSAPDGVLTTSATVEMVYILSKLVM